MEGSKRKIIVLVDSNALAHRAFHAYPPELMNSKGEHTNAIFGYFTMLVQTLITLKPESIICVFDAPGRTFRDDMYEKYKANRPEMDASLAEQIPKIINTLRNANIHALSIPTFEADDVIGSLSKSEHLTQYDKVIVTGDRDLFQVIDDNTSVYLAGNPFSNSHLFNKEQASEKMGFDISNIILFKALKGDPSDNIPGVPGIGDVSAINLIKDYKSLDEIYKSLDQIKPSISKKLQGNREIAELSYRLAEIKTDEDIHIDIDNFDMDKINFDSLIKEFEHFGFRTLIKKIEKINPAHKFPLETFPAIQTELITEHNSKYQMQEIINETGFNEMLMILKEAENVAIFAEEISDKFIPPEFIGFAVNGYSFVVKNGVFGKASWEKLLNLLKAKIIYTYNSKYLYHILANLGVFGGRFPFTQYEDIMLSRFITSMGTQKDPSSLFNETANAPQQSLFIESVIYDKTYSLLGSFIKPEGKMFDLYNGIEKPIALILGKMERAGVRLDRNKILQFKSELEENIGTLTKEIYKDAGEEFNISSPKQLGAILFQKLGIKTGKKNKSGGFSTNEKYLLDHINNPIIPKILSYRELSKLNSTYTNALIEQINPKTNRIHSNFNQAVAVTGRLSSTEPNLQNIPTSTDWGLRIKKAFVPSDNKLFVSFDYSQQELRLLAEFSGDKNLIKAFNSGFDIHAYTASRIFNIDMQDVDSNQRRTAKTVNFGVVYGISAYGLASRLKIPTGEAQDYIDRFYTSYPGVLKYFKNITQNATMDGFVETVFGRRRKTDLLTSSNYQVRSAAERETINFPLQGSASDIIKKAMIDADKIIAEKYKNFAIMILQVHDEIIFEVDTNKASDKRLLEFARDIRQVMIDGVKLGVPMLVDAKCGSDWADLKKLTNI